jgi:hypothetical protein
VKRRAAVLAALAAVLAGCGSHHQTLRPDSLSSVVLHQGDLPGWTRFQNDPGTAADAGALASRERTGDWIARFRRAASIVVSRVDIYKGSKAAHAAFENVSSRSDGNGVLHLKVPALGDERAGYAVRGPSPVTVIFWRRGNAVGSLVAQGRGIAAAPLAQREDDRIEQALG